jgi:TonB family protein
MTSLPHVEGRWWGSTSASISAHVVLFVLVLFFATRVSNISDAARAVSPPLVFVPQGGSGGGGGGGGDLRAQPPRAALMKPAPAASIPTPSQVLQPPASVPAVTTTAVETLPGALAPIDASMALGRGNGPGGGAGRGPGNGPGDGSGLGDGRLAGLGDDVYVPGNGVSSPVLLREVKPNYTAEALRAKVQGTVEMDAVVLSDGTIDPRTIRIVRSLDQAFGLDREAIEAVKQWRFKPAMRKGQAVAALVTLELAFTIR